MSSRVKRYLVNTPVYIILFIVGAMVIIPGLWMVLCAFKPQSQIICFPPSFWPKSFTLDNFTAIAKRIKIIFYVKNTVIYALVTTVPSVFINALAGYAFARLEFKGKNVLFVMVLATMMIPFQITMVPMFLTVYKLGMYNTYAGLIIPKLANAISVFMMRAAFSTLPKELEEAARIDGTSEIGIFWRIMLPLVKPAMVTLVVLGVNGAWNDLLWPLLVTSSTNMRTLANGLALFVGENTTQYGAAFAGAFISILPMFILYVFGQRYFVEGTATSGLKG